MLNNAEQMLAAYETLHLGVIDESGCPMIYPMEKVASNGLEKVVFITDFEQIKQIVPQNYWNRLRSHTNYKDYCVLVFETETAKVYLDGKTETVQVRGRE